MAAWRFLSLMCVVTLVASTAWGQGPLNLARDGIETVASELELPEREEDADIAEQVVEIIDAGPGTKPALGAIGAAATLIPELTKAAKEIWAEYGKLKKERRSEVLAQLDGLRWKPFHELGGTE